MTIYAATSNPGKLAEFATSASTQGITVEPLPNLKSILEPEENAATFMGNAEIKAIAYSLAAPGLLVFADDSGLEAEALGNRPGVRSARFADDLGFESNYPAASQTRDSRNNRALLSLLNQNPNRNARFVCTLALAQDGKILHRATGEVAGQLLEHPRGKQGFGYDPLFLIPHLNLTMAELDRDQKWQLSHRGNAFRNLLQQLQSTRS